VPTTVSGPLFGDFWQSRAMAPGLEIVDSIASTNAELARRERLAPQPNFTALATLDQTAGRGRLGRSWVAPRGAALAVSIVVRPSASMSRWGWLTLLGGLAVRRAVAAELPDAEVSLKWPNDVLVRGRKVAGILAELVPETGAVIVGIGINTAMTEEERPVDSATSIAIERGELDSTPEELADRLLAHLLAAFAGLVGRFEAADGDVESSGLRLEVERACGTIGRRVRVELPDGESFTGRAIGIGAAGALSVVSDERGEEPTAILAGDVTHLRYQ